VNYGVALRRGGDLAGAEAAYRKSLEVEPTEIAAYQNLAALLRLRGADAEAGDLLALSDRQGTRNPFIYLALGDLSLAHGRTDEARRFFRKSLRLYPKSAEPYAAMGLLSLTTGDTGDAARWLRKAVAIDQENDRVKLLAGRLGKGKKPSPPVPLPTPPALSRGEGRQAETESIFSCFSPLSRRGIGWKMGEGPGVRALFGTAACLDEDRV
jgi:tetratricopeptide (TPR) repeat protein